MERANEESDHPRSRASAVPIHEGATLRQVPEAWLRGEHLTAAERVDRLAGDATLMAHLRATGFTGHDYEYFAVELSKYGMAVIGGWIRRGLIFDRCRSKGFGGLERPPQGKLTEPDTVEELTGETVAVALRHFRTDVLIPGRWDPAKGASLKTFFIGQCLMRFPNVYRQWLADLQRNDAVLGEEMDLPDRLAVRPLERGSPDDDAIIAMMASEALAHIKDPRVRRAMVMSAVGYKQGEIAMELGVSEKTVERMMASERARARKRGA